MAVRLRNQGTGSNGLLERRVFSLLRCGAYRLHLGDDIEQALDLLEPLFD